MDLAAFSVAELIKLRLLVDEWANQEGNRERALKLAACLGAIDAEMSGRPIEVIRHS